MSTYAHYIPYFGYVMYTRPDASNEHMSHIYCDKAGGISSFVGETHIRVYL